MFNSRPYAFKGETVHHPEYSPEFCDAQIHVSQKWLICDRQVTKPSDKLPIVLWCSMGEVMCRL